MKLVLDERVKHRIIGLAVILSIGAIFAPAIVKKSNQRFDGNVNVSVQLPPKPLPPKVAMPDEKAMFGTVKVAHVELPALPDEKTIVKVAKAEPLSPMNDVRMPVVAKANVDTPSLPKAKTTPVSKPTVAKMAAKKVVKNIPQPKAKVVAKINKKVAPVTVKASVKGRYAVQLATFSQQRNADTLVSKLRGKGYKATYNKITTTDGTVYKVIVGHTDRKEQARILQKQLASVMQINGFIVETGVS
ncbi:MULTISPECIES: SPOR domain-containing protein [unclassified Legionella]|uniref:SPOR domain-containing protein n=1 Tax=unclassified Legionella TaxID=2622702 RepID=UPI001E38245C|nr:SPOR domain-containing protein [Legionella sp. 31fI33]MCC5015918.1 SPOR domain-containing protein [Legionella sp. 31fI33]